MLGEKVNNEVSSIQQKATYLGRLQQPGQIATTSACYCSM